MPGISHTWQWQREELVFLADRALWRPKASQLFVADLHLGKAELLQRHGIPIPSDGDQGTLNPLIELCQRFSPQLLIVLGDLIHGELGLTERLRQILRSLPDLCGCPVRLIGGNHDRSSRIEGLPQQPSYRCGDLWLSHEPETPPEQQDQLLNVCGHVHPVAGIGNGCDRLRLPCFAYNPSQQRLLIPAFGQLTGGHHCDESYRKWLVADHAIVPWFEPHPNRDEARVAR